MLFFCHGCKNVKERLVNKDKFYGSLTRYKNNEDYENVLKNWNKFEIKVINDLYLKINAFLLVTDKFESFRNNCLNNYVLTHSHCLSDLTLKLW